MSLPASRKLTGLLICLGALLTLAAIATVAVTVFGVGEALFAQIGGYIAALGGAHQTAQAMADRSPNYPNNQPNQPTPVAPAPPGRTGSHIP